MSALGEESPAARVRRAARGRRLLCCGLSLWCQAATGRGGVVPESRGRRPPESLSQPELLGVAKEAGLSAEDVVRLYNRILEATLFRAGADDENP